MTFWIRFRRVGPVSTLLLLKSRVKASALMRRMPTPVKVFFANGTSLEFCSVAPEQFALQAQAMGGRFS